MTIVLGTFLTELAKKAGVDEHDKSLIDLLTNSELSKIKINEALSLKMNEGLLSVDTAVENHPKIRSKYLAEFFNAIDKKIEGLVSSIGLADDKLMEFNSIKGTYNRIEKLSELIKSKIVDSSGSEGGESEQIKLFRITTENLKVELVAAKKALTDKVNEFEALRKLDKIEFLKNQAIAERKTTLDNLAPGAKRTAYSSILNEAIKSRSLSVEIDEAGDLILITTAGGHYLSKENKKISFAEFLTEIEIENKLMT